MTNQSRWSFEQAQSHHPAISNYLQSMLPLLLDGFSKEELEDLFFALNLDYDDLPGDGRSAKARELLTYCYRHGRLEDLDSRLREKRPDIPWPLLPEEVRFFSLPPPGKLAQLPTDQVPEVGLLPPKSRMTLNRNELFTGRQSDLKTLAQTLKSGQTVAVGPLAAVTGMGGIGKTQLAVEFVYRYGRYFAGGVYWLSFADPDGIPAEFTQCGLVMGLYDEVTDTENQAALVKEAWTNPIPRLLIFDNLDARNAEQILAQWRPKGGGARVLVTSRRGLWSPELGLKEFELGVLNREESVKLLQKFHPDLEEEVADKIAGELGDLPLALHLAGSFLAYYEGDVTAEAYLAEWRDEHLTHESMAGEWLDFKPTDREMHLFNTFMISYGRLRPEVVIDRLAIDLAARAAYFAPGEPIPWHLLRATLLAEEAKPKEQRRLTQARKRLESLGLLEVVEVEEPVQGVSLKMHRLVALFVQGAAEGAGLSEETLLEVENLIDEEASRLNDAGYPARLLAWQGHLRYVTDRALLREDELAASLSYGLGYHLKLIGDYEAARPYYERALAITENSLGPDDPHTAMFLNNMGYLLNDMGDYEAARPYLERSLAINEKSLGPDHRETATSLNNLGFLLQGMGDYEAARPYYERALAISEKVLGPDDPDTVINLNNLGFMLNEMGEYEAARPFLERALTIREKVLGPDHPDTAQSLHNLGLLLHAIGDYEEARPYFERAQSNFERVLGPDHPHTATSLDSLGGLLQDMGDYDAARPCYERALAIHEQVLGPDHPDTAGSLNNLGILLVETGDYWAARTYIERALAIREQVLGPDHPETAECLWWLGVILEDLGDLAAARGYYQSALTILEEQLGPDHLDTIFVRESLEELDL